MEGERGHEEEEQEQHYWDCVVRVDWRLAAWHRILSAVCHKLLAWQRNLEAHRKNIAQSLLDEARQQLEQGTLQLQ